MPCDVHAMYLAYGLVSLEKYDADPSLCTPLYSWLYLELWLLCVVLVFVPVVTGDFPSDHQMHQILKRYLHSFDRFKSWYANTVCKTVCRWGLVGL